MPYASRLTPYQKLAYATLQLVHMFTVSAPGRLDAFLIQQKCFLSRAKAQKAIEAGLVIVDDEVVTKPSYQLAEGDEVSVEEHDEELEASHIQVKDLLLSVLYEDDVCLVINKPAGFAVHPGAGMTQDEVTVLHGVAFLFAERSLPFLPGSVLVHRLDKNTTGCLLIAKNEAAHKALQKQFEDRTVEKLYVALVAGIPSPKTAIIDAPIGRSPVHKTKMSVLGLRMSRNAKTTYRTLAANAAKTVALLECDLHTGRTHQIRVHLHAIGYPILGDESYTTSLSEKLTKECEIEQICLHAEQLTFVSPADKKEHHVKAPLPVAFVKALKAAEIHTTLK